MALGPKLLSLERTRNVSMFVCAAIGILCFVVEFPRFPLHLKLALFLFGAFKIGHLFHRLYVVYTEIDVLLSLCRKSKICVLKYACGDLVLELVLSVLTVVYYKTHCNGSYFFALLCSAVVAFFARFRECPERAQIRRAAAEKYRLNVGYGLAYFYYYNYLVHINKDNKFRERLAAYVSEEEVPIFSCRLFILVPYSCVVEKYIDNDIRESLRTKEIKPLQLDVAGIKGREYVNTVYELFPGGSNNPQDIIRCVIECAQPLKQLHELYSMGKISEQEMFYERKSFICNLERFLRDKYNSFKTVVLVQVSDSENLVQAIMRAAAEPQD